MKKLLLLSILLIVGCGAFYKFVDVPSYEIPLSNKQELDLKKELELALLIDKEGFFPYTKAPELILPIRPEHLNYFLNHLMNQGLQGTVTVGCEFYISKYGTTHFVECKSLNGEYDDSEIILPLINLYKGAVSKAKWKPAENKEGEIGVWRSVAQIFELTSQ